VFGKLGIFKLDRFETAIFNRNNNIDLDCSNSVSIGVIAAALSASFGFTERNGLLKDF
jgi:hypothetical protein